MKTAKKTSALLLAALAVLTLTAGSCGDETDGDQQEKAYTERAQKAYNVAQPPHQYDASQARENLIAAHDAMAYGANSWTVQYVEGVGITFQCPSRGFPIPFGSELTNPEKSVYSSWGNFTLPQMEPYGIYPPPDVPATFANCVLPSGDIGIFYSEPPLTTFLFDVTCDETTKRCQVSANAKATVTVKKVDSADVNARPADISATEEPTTGPS